MLVYPKKRQPATNAPVHKPGLAIMIGVGHPKGPGAEDGPPDDGVGIRQDAGAVQCPNCGCEFDPATGDIMNDQGGQGPPPQESDDTNGAPTNG